jgi:hypothetical protein
VIRFKEISRKEQGQYSRNEPFFGMSRDSAIAMLPYLDNRPLKLGLVNRDFTWEGKGGS